MRGRALNPAFGCDRSDVIGRLYVGIIFPEFTDECRVRKWRLVGRLRAGYYPTGPLARSLNQLGGKKVQDRQDIALLSIFEDPVSKCLCAIGKMTSS